MDAIVITQLSKMYKLYRRPFYKVVDIFGFGFLMKNYYNEFWALRNISLSIKKGEKVAFIGRNGAGKSTLLKIIAGNVPYTSGNLSVNGKINALFTLGTGFHPDFSGRENVFAALAYQGIVEKDAENRYTDIVEFSELEDFINNPVKTYSAGMYVRLAFSVATVIEPDILILDEILGAGDAYFNSKAVERMRNLTGAGTTVLFVTHDLSSAQRLCERAIWIDKGKIIMDGYTLDVIKAYGSEIRNQEEKRLKAKSLLLSRKSMVALDEQNTNKQMIFHLLTEEGKAPRTGLPVHEINFYLHDELIESIKVGDSMDNDTNSHAYIIIDDKYINWTRPTKLDNKWVREFKDIGGLNKHAAFIVNLPVYYSEKDLTTEIKYRDDSSESIKLEVYNGKDRYIRLGNLDIQSDKKWKEQRFRIEEEIFENGSARAITAITEDEKSRDADVDGTGELDITRAYFADINGAMKFTFQENEIFMMVVEFAVHHTLEESPHFSYTVYSDQGIYVDNYWNKIDITKKGKYTLKLNFNRIFLKRNKYIWSMAFLKKIDLIDNSKPWPYYVHWDRKLELIIVNDNYEAINRGLISLEPRLEITDEKAKTVFTGEG